MPPAHLLVKKKFKIINEEPQVTEQTTTSSRPKTMAGAYIASYEKMQVGGTSGKW